MAKKKKLYQPLVSDVVADLIPGDINGWSIGFSNSYRLIHGGNGTLISYSKNGVSIELGRSGIDYYVLIVGDIYEEALGWSSDIAEMISLLTNKLKAQ